MEDTETKVSGASKCLWVKVSPVVTLEQQKTKNYANQFPVPKDLSARQQTKVVTGANVSGASKSPWAEVSPVLTI